MRFRTQRVLVVDDNRDAADSLTMILEALGAERVAYAGPEALDALVHHDAGVVELDIGMPGMDGYEVDQAIRRAGPGAEPHPDCADWLGARGGPSARAAGRV